jgi:hypothetical protein
MKIPLIDMVLKYIHMDHVVAAVVAQAVLAGQKILFFLSKRFKRVLSMKYHLIIVASGSVFIYNWLFKAVTKSGVAVMQLEDSDSSYAIASKVATSSTLWSIAATISVVTFCYAVYKIRTKKP